MWTDKSVHFNFGQKLVPEQLNSIGQYSKQRDEVIEHITSGGRGIVKGYGDELNIIVSENDPLMIAIMPGAVLGNFGQLIIFNEPILMNLNGIVAKDPQQFVLYAYEEQILENPVTDHEIPELGGHQYRTNIGKVGISKEVPANGIAIGHVKLDKNVERLTVQNEVSDTPGVIYTCLRPYYYSFNRYFVDYTFQKNAKTYVSDFRASLIQVGTVFVGLKSLPRCIDRVVYLEAEISDRFFIMSKISYLLMETHKVFNDLVEDLRHLTRDAQRDYEQVWQDLFALAESLKSEDDNVNMNNFKALSELASYLRTHLIKIDSLDAKNTLIQESLADIKAFPFGYHRKHSFGGTIFKKIDSIGSTDFKERLAINSDFTVQRIVEVNLGEGKSETIKGQFVGKGSIEINLANLTNDKLAIIMLKCLKRRGALSLTFIMNGQPIQDFNVSSAELVNQAINLGALINPSKIIDGDNLLTIQVNNTDLDVGILEVTMYQESETKDL
ncbi:MAG: hypothetical protein H6622_01185 [Halobacteriovoraceae bacterium]|nr:hypothetical protein [Halobacteriovoraceae bacterium]